MIHVNSREWIEFDGVGEPEDIRNRFYGFEYRYIEEDRFIIPANVFLEGDELSQERINAARARFKKLGWKGEGEIGILWIPPIVKGLRGYNSGGVCVWHVRQEENGVSYLLAPSRFDDLGC